MAGPYYVKATPSGDELGGNEANAMSLADAADAVVAGDTVYVKTDGDYVVQDGIEDCVLNLSMVGAEDLFIDWIGYKTTITDGGIVKIDADVNSLANAVKSSLGSGYGFNTFVNFDFQGASSHGFNGSTTDSLTFKNCRFYLNDGAGITGDNYFHFVNCIASNNGGNGFDVDIDTHYIACVSHTNNIGFVGDSDSVAYNCLAYNNSSHDYNFDARSACLGITSDCEGAAGDYCINVAGSQNSVVNCVLHDGDYGVYSDINGGESVISRHNVFNSSNTRDVREGFWLEPSEGDGVGNKGDVVDPANMFLNEGADDYTPHASGGMLGVGIDAYFCQQFWADYNDGAGDNPPSE